MMKMLSDVGFLHLKNVAGFDEDELLKTVKEFHTLPEKIKHKMKPNHINKDNSNMYRGWFPFMDNDISHKEFFDMGCDYNEISENQKAYPIVEETPFPKSLKYKSIVKKYHEYWKFQLNVCLKLLEYLAIGLGKERHYFKGWFEKNSLSTFRTIHYLPRSDTGVKTNKLTTNELKLITPGHTDTGFITLLSTFMFPGLQVLIDGKYRSVKPEKNNIVVNLGTIFARVTNQKLKATMHRVLDIGKERYSSPFFLEPRYDAVIPSDITKREDEQKEPPIEYGIYSVVRIRSKYVEWQGLKLPGEEGYIPKKLVSKINID